MSNISAENIKAGKRFEKDFSQQYRSNGYELVRLLDVNKNRQPCDYFSVLPGMTCFFELKSTACPELPLIDIRPHQLEKMNLYDRSAPGVIHAGFIIQFRSSPNNQIYYMPGKAMSAYAAGHAGNAVLDSDYLAQNGILIPTHKASPAARKYTVMDIPGFLSALSALQNRERIDIK